LDIVIFMVGKKKFKIGSKYHELKHSLAMKIIPENNNDEEMLHKIISLTKKNTQNALAFFYDEYKKFSLLESPKSGICDNCKKFHEPKLTKSGRTYGGLEYSTGNKEFCKNCFKTAWSLFAVYGKHINHIDNPENIKKTYLAAAFDTASPIFTKWITDDVPRFNQRIGDEIDAMKRKIKNINKMLSSINPDVVEAEKNITDEKRVSIMNSYGKENRKLVKERRTKAIIQEEIVTKVAEREAEDRGIVRAVVLSKKVDGLKEGIKRRRERIREFNTTLPQCHSDAFQIRCSQIKFIVDGDTPLVGITHPFEVRKWLRFKILGKDFQWPRIKDAIKAGYAEKVYPEIHEMIKRRVVGKKLRKVREYYVIFPMRMVVRKPRITKDMPVLALSFSPYAVAGCLWKKGTIKDIRIFIMKKYRIREYKLHQRELLKAAARYFLGRSKEKAILKKWRKIRPKPKKERSYTENERRFGFNAFKKKMGKKEARFVNYMNHKLTSNIVEWVESLSTTPVVAVTNYKFIKNVNYKSRDLQFELKNWSVAKQHEFLRYKLLQRSVPFETIPYKDTKILECYRCGHKVAGKEGFVKTLTEKMKLTKTFRCPECDKIINFEVNDSLRIAKIMDGLIQKGKTCKCGTVLDFAPMKRCVFCKDTPPVDAHSVGVSEAIR